jgi:ribosome-binding protein aMBF1 (putative translation factor)
VIEAKNSLKSKKHQSRGERWPEMTFEYMTLAELAAELGTRVRDLRVRHRFSQDELAAQAGLGVRAIRDLERGKGSTVESLLKVLKALDSLEGLSYLAPRPSVDPIALLKQRAPLTRVRKSRNRKPEGDP